MGLFPRVVYWDDDERKDLLVGQADGTLLIFLNEGSDDDPYFDGGTHLQVGDPGSKVDIDVGYRATPDVVDWNNDGRKDLVVGSSDGMLHIFINEGADSSPDFLSEQFAQENGADMIVPSVRSSPVVTDLDDDQMKDVLTGNTDGQLLFYTNVGTDEAPFFSGYVQVESDGVPIDLNNLARSRPFVCDWTGDGFPDVLIGAGDGLVHLYQGVEDVGTESWNDPPIVPRTSRLLTPYPNPFNPSMTIPFEIAGTEQVLLSVYDIRGRMVSILANRLFAAGEHRVVWQGRDNRGRSLSSGIYIIHLRAGDISETAKVTLLR
jgi:hypothetical protein